MTAPLTDGQRYAIVLRKLANDLESGTNGRCGMVLISALYPRDDPRDDVLSWRVQHIATGPLTRDKNLIAYLLEDHIEEVRGGSPNTVDITEELNTTGQVESLSPRNPKAH